MRLDDAWGRYVKVIEQRGKVQAKKTVRALRTDFGDVVSWAKEKKGLKLVRRYTGLRKIDVFKLKWNMVDFERGVIELGPSKTRNYQIAVSIPMVGKLRSAREEEKKKCDNADVTSEYVFPKFAEAYPNAPWGEDFGKILERAGVKGKGYTFHSYRHTFRTRLKEASVPDELAKELGGWTQDATLARYNHADETEKLRAMMEKGA